MGCTSVKEKRETVEPPQPSPPVAHPDELRKALQSLGAQDNVTVKIQVQPFASISPTRVAELLSVSGVEEAGKRGAKELGLLAAGTGLQRCVLGIGAFALYVMTGRRREDMSRELHALFEHYDVAHSGVISREHLDACLAEQGIILSAQDRSVLTGYVGGGSGKLTYPEFCAPIFDALSSQLVNVTPIRGMSQEQYQRLLSRALRQAKCFEDVVDVMVGLGLPISVVPYFAAPAVLAVDIDAPVARSSAPVHVHKRGTSFSELAREIITATTQQVPAAVTHTDAQYNITPPRRSFSVVARSELGPRPPPAPVTDRPRSADPTGAPKKLVTAVTESVPPEIIQSRRATLPAKKLEPLAHILSLSARRGSSPLAVVTAPRRAPTVTIVEAPSPPHSPQATLPGMIESSPARARARMC